MHECSLVESIRKFIGQTVTVFTTSGGLSGEGFTGVLASVTDCTIKLITDFGQPPTCPLGSSCTGSRNNGFSGFPNNRGVGKGCCCSGWVGSVTEIPICKIAGFTHNAV